MHNCQDNEHFFRWNERKGYRCSESQSVVITGGDGCCCCYCCGGGGGGSSSSSSSSSSNSSRSDNQFLRTMEGQGYWTMLHNEELHNSYRTVNIAITVK